jgi:hypothetical protein
MISLEEATVALPNVVALDRRAVRRRFEERALEAAESLGPDHYVIDRHGLQIWNPQRKLLRNEE